MTLKVAIVGCGKFADAHVTEIRALPQLARLVAVADREPLMATQLAERFDVPARYGDLGELLDRERPDVVHLVTPPATHLGLARQALEAGCHLVVEKPLALHHHDTVELLAAAQRADRLVVPGYTYWMEAPAVMLRDRYAAGHLGRPIHLEAAFGYSLTSIFGQAAMSDPAHWVHDLPGGLLHNQIDHLLSPLLEYLPPDSPIEVHALAHVGRGERFGDRRDLAPDTLSVQLRSGGVTAHGLLTPHAKPRPHRLRVIGDGGSAELDFVARTLTSPGREGPSALGRLLPAADTARQHAREALRNGARFARNEFGYLAGMRALLAAAYEAMVRGGPPPVPPELLTRLASVTDTIWTQISPASGSAPNPA